MFAWKMQEGTGRTAYESPQNLRGTLHRRAQQFQAEEHLLHFGLFVMQKSKFILLQESVLSAILN